MEPFGLNSLLNDCLACRGLPTRHLAADGNFRTGRRKNGGASLTQSACAAFLLSGKKIKDFVESSVSSSQTQTIQCSGFKAGDISRSRSRFGIFDETGLIGLFCARHGVPILFGSMFHGERFGYMDFILKAFVERNPDVEKVVLYYDVSCRFKSHFKVCFDLRLFSLRNHSIPFHRIHSPLTYIIGLPLLSQNST
jgi:hypothetical protein